MSKIGFRTRTRGTLKQIGKRFPLLEKKKLPKLDIRKKRTMHGVYWRKPRLYKATFTYGDGTSEKVEIVADHPGVAFAFCLGHRKYKDKIPVKVEMVNSIAGVAAAIAGGVVELVGGTVAGVVSGVQATTEAYALRRAKSCDELRKIVETSPSPAVRAKAAEIIQRRCD